MAIDINIDPQTIQDWKVIGEYLLTTTAKSAAYAYPLATIPSFYRGERWRSLISGNTGRLAVYGTIVGDAMQFGELVTRCFR